MAGEEDSGASGDDGRGGEGVAGHMDECRPQVDVAGHAPEQGGDDAVHDHAGGGHVHHQPGLNGDWRIEAVDGFDPDPEGDEDEGGRR